MIVTTARYPTVHGSKYLQQLSKHFAHKVEVVYDEVQSNCTLPSGTLEMKADAEAVSFRIESEDAKAMISARFVVDSHLVTFAHRENFTGLTWVVEAA